MKKNLFSLSILAIALMTGSCVSDLNEGQTPGANDGGQAITFEAWANKQTRAASTAADITDFRLLAWQDVVSGSVLINGALVTGGGSNWTYSPLAYWPGTDTVNFYAFSPAGSSGVTNALAGQPDPPIINYELPGHSVNTTTTLADQEDLLVTNHTGDYAREGSSGVTLNFRHALSRILVQAKSEGLNNFVVLGVTLKNIKSSGTLNLGDIPKDTDTFPYPTDNTTVGTPGYQTFWNTAGGQNGNLAATNIPIGGDSVKGGSAAYTDIIGNDDALYVIPQTNPASSLKKTTLVDGTFTAPPEFYIEITYQEAGPGAQPVTYAVPVPAIVGDANASSIAFEMERQYTFQFELFGNNKPIVITNVTASAYKDVKQEEPLRLTWAGSNIYWDGAKLTFADSGDKTKEQYQGVFFKWGSLVGISPSGNIWSPQTTYVPNVAAIDGSWTAGTTTYVSYADIPYITAEATPYTRDHAYLTAITNNTDTVAALKGDICVYLTKIGAAPKGKRWRMPTSLEFDAVGDYVKVGTWAATAGNADGTTLIPGGYRRQDSNTPYLPATGSRTESGELSAVGTFAHYWSSSPASLANGYYLAFSYPAIETWASYYRTNGFTVRCVVE